MSQTVAVNMTGASRWSYMATVVANALGKMLEGGRTNPESIPVAVRHAANDFFRLALDARKGAVPRNPQLSVASYRIAADAARATSQTAFQSRDDLEKTLSTYAETLELLDRGDDLEAESTERLRELRLFLRHLATAGEMEEYDRIAGAETVES